MSILDALSCGRSGCACGKAAQRGHGITHCPAHDDRTPSLSVRAGTTQPVVVHCHASCDQEAVIDVLKARKLWAGEPTGPPRDRETRWEIRDVDGVLVAVHVRTDPGKRFYWELPDGTMSLGDRPIGSMPLYNAHKIASWRSAIIVCEGEKAADALWKGIGVPAVGVICGAGATPDAAALRALAGRVVYLWPDADPPPEGKKQGYQGQQLMERVGATLTELGIPWRVIAWHEAPPHGDAFDFLGDGGDRLALEELKEAAGCAHKPALAQWEEEIPMPTIHGEHPCVCSCCCRLTSQAEFDKHEGRCATCAGPVPVKDLQPVGQVGEW